MRTTPHGHHERDFAISLVCGVTFAVVTTLSHVAIFWNYGWVDVQERRFFLLGFKLSEFVYFVLFYFVFVVTVEVVKEEEDDVDDDEEDDENDKEEKDQDNSKSDSSEREELWHQTFVQL